MARFRLSKWYLDCVTDQGDASICYTGKVAWGFFRLHYASLLETTGAQVASSQSLRSHSEPQLQNGSLHWRSDAVHACGEWKFQANISGEPPRRALRKTIFSSPEGSIDWHCFLPCGPAHIGNRAGLGYVEQLAMTIPPWRLPLRTLRWGRFTSSSHYLVWIDCLGDFSTRVVYLDGLEATARSLQDDLLELSDGTSLTLDRSVTIRRGTLGTTVLSAIPAGILPARILQLHEHKWRSRAQLARGSQPAVEGWAIHERVDWPA